MLRKRRRLLRISPRLLACVASHYKHHAVDIPDVASRIKLSDVVVPRAFNDKGLKTILLWAALDEGVGVGDANDLVLRPVHHTKRCFEKADFLHVLVDVAAAQRIGGVARPSAPADKRELRGRIHAASFRINNPFVRRDDDADPRHEGGVEQQRADGHR